MGGKSNSISTLTELYAWLESIGAERVDRDKYIPVLDEPALHTERIDAIFTIDSSLLPPDEALTCLDGQIIEEEDDFDPNLPASMRWYEAEYLELVDGLRVFVVVERSTAEDEGIGSYLVAGFSSWLADEIYRRTGKRNVLYHYEEPYSTW
jgi:hypothetical protein